LKAGGQTADDFPMEPCPSCGAALSADAQWCGQCYAVLTPAASAQFGGGAAQPVNRFGGGPSTGGASVMAPTRTAATLTSLPATMVKSRWRKSATTFGPIGRVLATIALVVPFVVFVVLAVFTGGLILGAPIIWGFVVMPWGLRDTWRAGQVLSN
jgi:hypothetical protein